MNDSGLHVVFFESDRGRKYIGVQFSRVDVSVDGLMMEVSLSPQERKKSHTTHTCARTNNGQQRSTMDEPRYIYLPE